MAPVLWLCLVLALCQHASGRPLPQVATLQKSQTDGLGRLDPAGEAFAAGPVQIDVGQVVEGRFIVVFNEKAARDAAAAAHKLVRHIKAAIASDAAAAAAGAGAASAAAAAAGPAPVGIVRRLGASQVSAGAAAAAAAAAAPASPPSGVQGVVLLMPATAVKHVRSSGMAKAVFPDRVVRAQAGCLARAAFDMGVSAAPSATFKWPGCLTANAKLVWMPKPCKDGATFKYTELRAVDASTDKVISANGTLCVLRPDPARPTWTKQRLGGCGVAPTFARQLPTAACPASDTPLPDAASPAPAAAPSPAPAIQLPVSPPPAAGPALPKEAVVSGEQLPAGITRIEAATAAGVANTAGLPVAQQTMVGIVDSGVEATHPELQVVGGASWVTPSDRVDGDVEDPLVDLYGHGTHVAGIVGARNSGFGVVGVAPNMPLYSLKVLNAEGKGLLSDALEAVKWVASAEGQAKIIRVINLSLATYVDPSSADYEATRDSVCAVFKEVSDAGVVVTAAAGNFGDNVRSYLPAGCPTVATVTAMDPAANASYTFTNWMPADASAEELASVFAAPGVSILSTISYARDASGHRVLSGTSMAAPHVAGVAATCIMAGACPAGASGAAAMAVLQAAALERLGTAGATPYGFKGDASSTINGKYLGRLVWAKY